MCSSLGKFLCETLFASWTWVTVSFPQLGKLSVIFFLNIFSQALSSSWDPYNVNISVLNSQRSQTVLIFFFSFLFSVQQPWFILLFSRPLIHSFVSFSLHYTLEETLYTRSFLLVYLFQFLYFSTLFGSIHFLTLLKTSNFSFGAPIFLLSSLIISTIITLNPFLGSLLHLVLLLGFYLVPSFGTYLSATFFCVSIFMSVWLMLSILTFEKWFSVWDALCIPLSSQQGTPHLVTQVPGARWFQVGSDLCLQTRLWCCISLLVSALWWVRLV